MRLLDISFSYNPQSTHDMLNEVDKLLQYNMPEAHPWTDFSHLRASHQRIYEIWKLNVFSNKYGS